MTEATKTLSLEARKLSPADRIDLVDDILASLDEPDPNIGRLWAREASATRFYWKWLRQLNGFAGFLKDGTAASKFRFLSRCNSPAQGIGLSCRVRKLPYRLDR